MLLLGKLCVENVENCQIGNRSNGRIVLTIIGQVQQGVPPPLCKCFKENYLTIDYYHNNDDDDDDDIDIDDNCHTQISLKNQFAENYQPLNSIKLIKDNRTA